MIRRVVLGALVALVALPVLADLRVNQLIGFGKLERRSGGAPYGTDLITGAETYSSDASSGTPANAANESQADAWTTENYSNSSKYWQVDFGAGVQKYVTKWQMDEFRADGAAITSVAISGSNNGTDFTTIDTKSGALTNNTTVTQEFNNTNGYRYYRLIFTRTSLGGASVEIIRMYESI